jgi:uncharacterized protein (TIGR02118 family)
MLKVVWIARFRTDVPKETARRHWRETHGVIGGSVPGLDRYVQSHVVGAVPPETDAPAFDGYSSGWYADDDAYVRSMASDAWAAIGADSDNLFDTRFFWGMSAFVDEHVLSEPHGAVKVGAVVRFAQGLGVQRGAERWLAEAAPMLGDVPGLAGCVLNVARDAIGVHGRAKDLALGFDGVAEYWFEDRTSLVRTLASPEWRAAQRAASVSLDTAATWSAVMEERLVKDELVGSGAGPAPLER